MLQAFWQKSVKPLISKAYIENRTCSICSKMKCYKRHFRAIFARTGQNYAHVGPFPSRTAIFGRDAKWFENGSESNHKVSHAPKIAKFVAFSILKMLQAKIERKTNIAHDFQGSHAIRTALVANFVANFATHFATRNYASSMHAVTQKGTSCTGRPDRTRPPYRARVRPGRQSHASSNRKIHARMV